MEASVPDCNIYVAKLPEKVPYKESKIICLLFIFSLSDRNAIYTILECFQSCPKIKVPPFFYYVQSAIRSEAIKIMKSSLHKNIGKVIVSLGGFYIFYSGCTENIITEVVWTMF